MFRFWKFFVIFCSLCLLCDARRSSRDTNNETDTSNDAKLIFAHIIYRHGDRNPISTYQTDPWRDESNWINGFGQLTDIGIKQQYEFGKYLRKRYASLLGDGQYSRDIIYIQSTDVDRTLMSAAANLAGLFPPTGDQIWNENLLWRPIPIHTIPVHLDHILYGGRYCPKYDRALHEYLGSIEYTDLYAKYKEFFQYLEEHSGEAIRSFGQVEALHDTLWIENLKNKSLPFWADEAFIESSDFKEAANYYFQIPTNTSLLARLSSGFLIREMLERFEQKIDSTLWPDRNLWMYSGHDGTISSVLNSLGLFDLHSPPYISSLYFELYQSKDEYYMQIVYRNTSDENPLPLEIPSCGTKCSLENFRRIYRSIIPTGTFEEECQLPLHIRIWEGGEICISNKWLIIMVCILCAIPFIAVIFWKLTSRNRGNITMQNDNQKYL